MIIKASRISTSSGSGAVANHVLRGPKNESIELLQGSESELRDAMKDAQAHGSKYGLRHYKISPGEATTKEDLKGIVADLGKEFGFDPATATIVWHQKPRAGGAGFDGHGHALVPEYNNETNRILDWSNSYARHEKISRMAEQKLGHAFIVGRHNASVAHALAEGGNTELSTIVGEFAQRERPESAYKATTHQRSARLGFDQANDKLAIRSAWELSDGKQAFEASLAEHGISVRPGEKSGIFIAERDGVFIGAVHRLVKEDKGVVAQRLQAPDITTPAIAPAQSPPTPASAIITAMTTPNPSIAMIEPSPGSSAPAPEVEKQDTPQRAKTAPTMPSPSVGGGVGKVSQSSAQPAQANQGGAVVEGPGEPPGPGAGPMETQAWQKRLYEYDQKRAQSRLATMKLLEANGGKNHGSVQNQARSAIPTAVPFEGNNGAGGGQSHSYFQRSEGRSSCEQGGIGGIAGNDATGPGGERPIGENRGFVGGDCDKIGEARRQAFNHRAELARATRGLSAINIEGLIDRLNPELCANRLIDQAFEDLAERRVHLPLDPTTAMEKARAELLRMTEIRNTITPIPAWMKWIPWTTALERQHNDLKDDIGRATSRVSLLAPPEPMMRIYREKLLAHEKTIERDEALIHAVSYAVSENDREMIMALVSGEINEAKKVQIERDKVEQAERQDQKFFQPGPRDTSPRHPDPGLRF